MSVSDRMSGLIRRIHEPDDEGDGRRAWAAWSEEARMAVVRGHAVPPQPVAPPSRVILDESGDGRPCDGPRFGIESVRCFDELVKLGGSASRSELQARIGGVLRGFVPDGIEDLKRLGVVSERGSGWAAVVKLDPSYERVRLSSRWSRAHW